MEDVIKISVKEESGRFKNFLSLEDNKKIIFSAPFGNGKTYFLNNFFKDNDEFQPFFIYPVHYVVSSNEDIFEYIKFDIIFKLLEISEGSEGIDFSNSILLPFFIQNKADELLSLVAEFSGKIGMGLKLLPQISKLNQLFIKYKNDVQKQDDDYLLSYLYSQKDKKGSIYESNLVTELLDSLIDDWKNKEENKNKSTILIIDDLDRLDPEHIFRIFNIFAAHSDYYQRNEIKFGFDKIVLVCDIDNIRNIFHAKYGMDVDFTGYIDKFYDKDIFNFDNRKLVEESLGIILKSMHFSDSFSDNFNFNHDHQVAVIVVKTIIRLFIKYNIISLRMLLKQVSSPIFIRSYYVRTDRFTRIHNINSVPFMIFDILKVICGSDRDLSIKIQKLTNYMTVNDIDMESTSCLFRSFIGLCDLSQNHLKGGKHEYTYSNNNIKYTLKYDLLDDIHPLLSIIADENISDAPLEVIRELLLVSLRNYLRLK